MRFILPCVMVAVGTFTFLTTLHSEPSAPGVTVEEPITKQNLEVECADQRVLYPIMKRNSFKIIATNITDVKSTLMVMLNPQGHVLVVVIKDNRTACIIVHMAEGTMISNELQLYLQHFNGEGRAPL